MREGKTGGAMGVLVTTARESPGAAVTAQGTAHKAMLTDGSSPADWLRKQLLLVGGKPTVAGIVLFADEPQSLLPKRTGIKLYRYKTKNLEGTRETLDFDPISIEGCAYDQIRDAVAETVKVIEAIRVSTPEGLESITYPRTA